MSHKSLSHQEAELLIKLSEEASEVIHAVSKILIHGWACSYADGTPNYCKLEKEIGDFKAVVEIIIAGGKILNENITKQETIKIDRILKGQYLHYQGQG